MKKRLIFVVTLALGFVIFFALGRLILFDSAKLLVPGPKPPIKPFFSLKFVNQQVLPHNLMYKGHPVGGLSALTHDQERKVFLALSDDKGQKGHPPRFYHLKLIQKNNKYQFNLIGHTTLKNSSGQKAFSPIDPEGISWLNSNHILISSEGAQMQNLKVPPQVFSFNSMGKVLFSWPLPNMYWPKNLSQLGSFGVQENKAFEALSVGPKKKFFYTATESPLHQDFDLPKNKKHFIRLSRFDLKKRVLKGQFVYKMDSEILIKNLKGLNGLTDFVFLGDKQLLTIERAYLKTPNSSKNVKMDANFVRLFFADCSHATDVSKYKNLTGAKPFVTCAKNLIIDLSSVLGQNVDNIEGIALGPKLNVGTYLLVLVSDNNFHPSQKTQFLFFHYTLLDKTSL